MKRWVWCDSGTTEELDSTAFISSCLNIAKESEGREGEREKGKEGEGKRGRERVSESVEGREE